jgi:hypothetical protein
MVRRSAFADSAIRSSAMNLLSSPKGSRLRRCELGAIWTISGSLNTLSQTRGEMDRNALECHSGFAWWIKATSIACHAGCPLEFPIGERLTDLCADPRDARAG